MSEASPRVSVVICTYRGQRVLPGCLRSLRAQTGIDYEVVVVDNGSPPEVAAMVRRDFPEMRLIQPGRNLGFAGGSNLGMRSAHGRDFVLLNDDTELPSDFLAKLIRPFDADPTIGAVGCKMLYPDGATLQHAGALMHPSGNTSHIGVGEADRGQWDEPGERACLNGAGLALRRAALEQVGLLDEGFHPAYFEETDLQLRMRRQGWRLWYEPAAHMIHHEAQTEGAGSPRFVYLYTRSRLRFLALNGLPAGRCAALGAELQWLVDISVHGRMLPALRAYGAGLRHGRAWRAERMARPNVPRLGCMYEFSQGA